MSNQPIISKTTFRGTLLFFLLLALIFVLPDVLTSFTKPAPIALNQLPIEYQQKLKSSRKNYKPYQRYTRESRYHAPREKFDPNTYTAEQWMELGLSEKQAAVVLKFTSRGVYTEDDVRKIFVIPEELFMLMKDSMDFPEKPVRKFDETKTTNFSFPRLTDLNRATEEDLMKVKGIGPFFAKQIVRTREKLGGFTGVEQLMDVWKMDEEKYAAIAPNVTVEPVALRKININTATAEELKQHPYVTWNVANSIVKLRTQNGPFKSVSGIKKSALIDEKLYQKLEPYFTIE